MYNRTCTVIDSNYTVLQCALNALCELSALWQLTISYKKCLRIGRNNITCNLRLNGNRIRTADSGKDLEVTVDNSL